MASETSESTRFSLIRPRLFVGLVLAATLALSGEIVGVLNLFGIETITDAIPPFLSMVVGGYLGIVISDRLL